VLDTLFSGREIITVFAMRTDKPYHICAPMLQKHSKHFIEADFSDIGSAVRKALSLAMPESVVIACGSLYMIGEAKKVMLEEPGSPQRRLNSF
jgi:folylpolyglutamate synthase/dihydropteroate synthase